MPYGFTITKKRAPRAPHLMTFTEILKKRSSMRRFDGRAVPRHTLENLLKLTLTAPSSKNTRSTRFMVVDKPEVLAKIAVMRDFGSAFIANAPCGVLVMGDSSATDLWLDNAAISATISLRPRRRAWVRAGGTSTVVRGGVNNQRKESPLSRTPPKRQPNTCAGFYPSLPTGSHSVSSLWATLRSLLNPITIGMTQKRSSGCKLG